jgi:hypothetical protein
MQINSACLLLVFVTPLLCAQDLSEDPTFGNTDLVSGFTPDPFNIELAAGGDIDASTLDKSCIGFISNAPDFKLDYESGLYPLYISVGSNSDTTLVVNLPDGSWLCDDDSGEGFNPMLEITDAASGVYDIWVGSYNEDGVFPAAMLYISELDGFYSMTLDPDENTHLENLAGNIYEGALNSSDTLEDNGSYSDSYSFDGTSGNVAIIDLRSADFDSYLRLLTPGGKVFINDDYSGDTSRSLISHTLEEDGTYTVVVTSFFAKETGDYALGIDTSVSSAAISLETDGTLTDGDELAEDGSYYDLHEIVGIPGRNIIIDMYSDDFDTYLQLVSPSGQIVWNDDADSIGHSRIETELSEAGTYYIYATTFSKGETGTYRLSLTESAQDGTLITSRDTRNITLGSPASGSLALDDAVGDKNEYMDYFAFSGEAGETIRFELKSDDFDTYLTVIDPAGLEYDNDDFNGTTNQSVVELTLPQSGRYSVIVSSYWAEETGNYNLLAMVGTGRSEILEDTDSQSSGQVYGIFVGISDYSELRQTQPGWGDLPFTSEDAMVARDTLLENAGMNPDNSIILVDHEATVENVRAAFADMAARIHENDTFVFFYSGHGGQEQRIGGFVASDADGYDETLALSNDTITDDEINELFNMIQASASLIILDSCYSGGFAKDVVSRPGRMGLFSSDEDVPSLVASKFLAGGYLSYFFYDAIDNGNADLNGDDAINAMELSQYIHGRYNAESLSKSPSDFDTPNFGYQHLVADRGGVAHDQILFKLR